MAKHTSSNARFKIRLHLIFSLVLVLHSLFFLVYWIAVGDFCTDVDQFVGDMLGADLPYITLIVILTVGMNLWGIIRFIGLRLAAHKKVWKRSVKHWLFIFIGLIFLAGFYTSYILILRENPGQKGVIIHLLNLVRLVSDSLLFLLAAIWLRRLILHLRSRQKGAPRKWPWTVGIVLVLISVVGLWLVPMLYPPNWAYQGDLPTKPALIAHRGASMLAPENTLAAAELAGDHQALGFETDLQISLDGVPFLMHDDTLARTTNIAEVFPDRVNDPASSFTLEEIKQLNAGLWFIQKDPFGTISSGSVSQSQLSINQGQKIPTLEETLTLVGESGLILIFDMRYPSEDHPYYDTFFEIVLETCRESGLNGDIWFLVGEEYIQTVIEEAPQMTRVVGASSTNLPDVEVLVEQQYEIVNVDTGIVTQEILDYREQGLGVNVYTVDEAWLFSQFWLSGVTSVTTNNVHTFSRLSEPFINIPYSSFLMYWSLFGIIIAIWLAASQPEQAPAEKQKMKTPNLMDFATEDDETVDTTQPTFEHIPPPIQEETGTEESEEEDHAD